MAFINLIKIIFNAKKKKNAKKNRKCKSIIKPTSKTMY